MKLEIEYVPDLQSFRRSMTELRSLTDRQLRSAIRTGMRKWGRGVQRTAKQLAPRAKSSYLRYPDSRGAKLSPWPFREPGGLLRRGIVVRVRTYRSGVVWMGIGVRRDFDYSQAGWRSHFAENGFYSRKHNRRFEGRKFLARAKEAALAQLRPTIVAELNRAILKAAP